MNALTARRIALLLAIVLGTAKAAKAQDAPPADDRTVIAFDPMSPDVDVAVDDLKLMLDPLRKEQLAEAAEAWTKALQTKATAVSMTEIAARAAEGDAKTALLEQAGALREERTALIDRLRPVLAALEAKGGDVEEYRLYIAAVSGVDVDVTDVSATWTTISNWVTSETGGIRWAKNIGGFVVTLIVAWIIARIIGGIVGRALGRFGGTSVLLRNFLNNLTRKVIMVVGVVIALSVLGVNIGPMVAAIGAAGLVLGFAFQETLGNFAAGIMILLYRPFDVGDVVDVSGVVGKVEAMSIVSTTVLTADNQRIIVPNGSIWGSVIKNITGNDTRRVDMTFGIGYDDDIEKARAILEKIVTGHPMVHADPAPVIKVHELADSSVNFIVRPWAKTGDYWDIYWDVTRSVKERFDAEGVSIPYPQQDVHMHQAAAGA